MPQRLKTPCRHPGCPNLSRTRFCEEHARDDKRPAEGRRGTAAERGYDRHWLTIAKERRVLDACLCQPCYQNGRLVEARTVDHIIPVHVRPDWRLEIENTQVICDSCHKQKTHEDNRRYGSSTETRLTDRQLENRAHAQRLTDAPRGTAPAGRTLPLPRQRMTGGGGVKVPRIAYYHAVPDARFSAKLGTGGVPGGEDRSAIAETGFIEQPKSSTAD